VKLSSAPNDTLIDRTLAVWRTRSQRELTREDARQIVENVSGFFSILYRWSRAEFGVAANDDGDRRGPPGKRTPDVG
jgi:hypothetical protein